MEGSHDPATQDRHRVYAVTCSCGYRARRPTLGQAASELIRHAEANPDHDVTILPPMMGQPGNRWGS